MITTVFKDQRKTLAAEDLAGPAQEVRLHQPIALCTWSRSTEQGLLRGTAMVLVEQDLLHWLNRSDGAEIKEVTVLMPTDNGWQPKNLTCLWYVGHTPEGSPAVVCRDVNGESFTLWPYEMVPEVSAPPTWTDPQVEGARA